jgi:hypothetical protein
MPAVRPSFHLTLCSKFRSHLFRSVRNDWPKMARLTPEQRPSLKLLASDPQGATEAFMHARGFSLKTLIGLVRSRLAIVRRQSVKTHGKTIEVVRLQITDAGQRAIEE